MGSLQKSNYPIQKAKEWLKVSTRSLELNSERTSKLSISQALKSPQLSVLLKADRKAAVDVVMSYVGSALICCGIENELLGREITKIFLNQNGTLKADEVAVILRDGISGRYGKIYGSLNIPVIWEWIGKHNENVAIHLEQIHTQEKDQGIPRDGRMEKLEDIWNTSNLRKNPPPDENYFNNQNQ